MIKFFGLLSKKKKIKPKTTATLFVALLEQVIDNGFVEIKEFLNNNNNLDLSPDIDDSDIDWFKNVVFLGNMQNISSFFEEEEVLKLRAFILDEMYRDLDTNSQHLAIERFLDYENYFKDLLKKYEFPIESMAHAIFEKYDLNRFQSELFRRKNKPNPILFNELKNLLKHFLWNWEDYLKKNKLDF